MDMKRCSNGHYYNEDEHTSCPHCGVEGLDLDQDNPTKPIIGLRDETDSEPGTKPIRDTEMGDETVPLYRNKKGGIDLVMGWLICVEGSDRGKDFRIHDARNFIGRGKNMDIMLTGDSSISRDRHAEVIYDAKANVFKVLPGDSKELIYMNDEAVYSPQNLKAYDVLLLGKTRLMFMPFCGDRFRW